MTILRRFVVLIGLAALQCGEVPPSHVVDRPARVAHRRYRLPAANLDVAWRHPGYPPSSVGRHLLSSDAKGDSFELDLLSGTPSRALLTQRRFFPNASRDDVLLASGPGPWVSAVDMASQEPQWRARCNNLKEDAICDVIALRVGSIAIFGGTTDYLGPKDPISIFAVDVGSGRELWRAGTDLEDRHSMQLAADGTHVYAMCGGRVLTFDLRTGEPTWLRKPVRRAPGPGHGTQLVARDGVVAFWESEVIHIADPTTGKDNVTIPWTDLVGDLLLDGGVLYVIPMWGHGAQSTAAAFDASNGRLLWRRQDDGRWPVPPALLDDDTIYVRRADQTNLALNDHGTEIVAIDRATGTIAWVRALRSIDSMTLVPMSDGPPLLVAQVQGDLIAFKRGEQPAPPIMVTISGTVTVRALPASIAAGLRVRVGDVVVTTDARGQFSARLSALGAVHVELLDLPKIVPKPAAPVRAEDVFVNVDRLGDSYTTELVVHAVEPWPPD